MKGTSAYKSLFLTVLHEITIIASLPHKNDSHLTRPKHAVSILSNKKNTRFVLLNTPADLRKHPKDLSSFKISPPDGADNKVAEYLCCKTYNTFQRHPAESRLRLSNKG